MPSRILGISAFYHDSAAALVVDGRVIAAPRRRNGSRARSTIHDFRSCPFVIASIRPDSKRAISTTWCSTKSPSSSSSGLLETYLAFAPSGYQSFRLAVPLWLKEKLFQKRLLRQSLNEIDPDIDWETRLLFTDHHQSHAASAFFPSPFRASRRAHARRRRRMDDDLLRLRRRQQARCHPRDPLSAFDRSVVFGIHLLHRLQGQFRRIQVDGARAVRRGRNISTRSSITWSI